MLEKSNHYNRMQNKERLYFVIFFLSLFCILYCFFRYAHPVVPWDGDDWRTLGYKIVQARTPYPKVENFESERMFCSFIGTICGYLAAFIVYPIVGDYVLSIVIVNAFILAITISGSLFAVCRMIAYILNEKNVFFIISITSLFLLFAFCFLKTRSGSAYLYWQFNLCTIYFYSVPSYLASAFGIYLVLNEVYNEYEWHMNCKTSVLMGIWYLLNFSFLPAALFLATISIMILFLRYVNQRSFKSLLLGTWFYWIVLFGTIIKILFEFKRTFGRGYLKVQNNLLVRIYESFLCLVKIFGEMELTFLLLTAFFILMALLFFSKEHVNHSRNVKVVRCFFILSGSYLMLFVFFVLFGGISIEHLYREIPRLDTLYLLYFLMILLVVMSVAYILNNNRNFIVLIPIVLFFLLFRAVSPENSFSDSVYSDSTPKQKYEIMNAIVKEVQNQETRGKTGLVVHMPRLNHYNGGMSELLYYHNVTNREMSIIFEYEERDDIYFEDYIL